ncbi:SusC/RagA family TonB-linked outer membrane protein [Maribacter ulvicola]|uniref:TonB-linked outer membrane protein, SusC/RagA family n=1 Tax=Maribacter ulvicola TaxID=228959 RepID=A0A1N6S4E1_9FLAO|nr:TonB-dependent receptor [Maribacter ulvicola]SIQ35964.1 TonB-linked outer membrane protein, SusC/RagA family [Maribacter ulvicola]
MKTKFIGSPIPYRKKLLITIMRTFIFLCCFATFGFAPKTGFSQNTTIKIKSDAHLTVVEIFDLIQKQTDHAFIYRSDLFTNAPKVHVKKGRINASELLKKSLSFGDIEYTFSKEGAILLNKKPDAVLGKIKQVQQVVTGLVTDKDGTPLPGANILEKGTSNGTQADFDGNFSLDISDPNAILVVSYIGFVTKETTIGNQTEFTILLEEDTQGLDEVVVVGYGTQKKSDVTGAISTVKGEELTQVVTTSPTDALQGRVSGVTVSSSSGSPGAAADVMIRGVGSFGNNQPLYIIDGVQADPYYIDANNIASIEVLKDAASASIYGTRAANGVIIITTKKGKTGKPKVEIGSSISLNTTRNEMELLDADGYVNVHRQMYENAGATLPLYVQNTSNINTDWIDETHRDGQLSLLNVRVSGASDNINYSVGGNFADEKGLLIGSEFSKKGINARLGITKDKLNINTNLTYSETKRRPQTFSLRETYYISPLIPVLDPSKPSGFGFRDGDLPDHRNPVGENKYLEQLSKTKYFLGNVSLDYEVLNGLTAKANLAYSNLSTSSSNFNKPFQVRDVQEEGREFAFTSEYNSELKRINQEYTLNYTVDLNKHSINLLAGYQRIAEPFKRTYIQAEGYKIIRTVDGESINEEKVPANILDPNFKTLDAFTDGTFAGEGTNAEYNLVSQFGRLNYSFDNKYLLQASARRDGSSKFGKNNQYGVFPSFALGWKISEEKFMKNQDFFNFMKLRYSWGQAGNDSALGYYDYVALIAQGKSQNDGGYVFGSPQTSFLGGIARDLQNDNLQWETNTSSNIGLDFNAMNNKLKGSINYYNGTTEDLLITRVVSPSAGVNSPIVNVGEFKNNGVEFEFGYVNKDNEFHYSAFATFTTINSEVTKLSNEDQTLYGIGLLFGSDHFVNQTKIGYEPGAYFLPVADGIFQSEEEIASHSLNGNPIQPSASPGDIRFVDQNGDGEINSDDETYQGSALPKYEYSLSLGSEYKGFDLNIFLQGVGGNKIYNGNDFTLMSLDTGRNFRTEALNAWTPTNTNTTIPRAVLGDPNRNNRASTRFLEDGDYIRIKSIQIGYTLPKDIIEGAGMSRLRLYASGQNLFTFTNYNGLDPEVSSSIAGQNQGILSRGIDRTLYPKSKSFILGVQVEF